MGEFTRKNNTRHSCINKKGFTLVELLVSATIILLCIIAIVAMLRKGREIDINDRYRRNARAIVVSEFENPRFAYINFKNLQNQTGTTSRTVVIDSLADGNALYGSLTSTIGAPTATPADDGISIPYIPVTIRIDWQTMEGNDNIIITKYISQ